MSCKCSSHQTFLFSNSFATFLYVVDHIHLQILLGHQIHGELNNFNLKGEKNNIKSPCNSETKIENWWSHTSVGVTGREEKGEGEAAGMDRIASVWVKIKKKITAKPREDGIVILVDDIFVRL